MSNAEHILEKITDIADEKNINLFDACIYFAEINNIEIEDLVMSFDKCTIDLLKSSALNENMVCNRKLFEPTKTTKLF